MASFVTIAQHTTASTPRPHILYTLQVTLNGKEYVVQRRYSEFVALHEFLKDPFNLPPKRLLVTTFIPSAWVDDTLIAERKIGLADYLLDILSTKKFKDQQVVFDFLTTQALGGSSGVDLEDALPSTLPRNALKTLAAEIGTAAVPIYGSYYPDWSASAVPPESLDYSKFDILYFAFVTPNSSSTISWGSGSQAILQRVVSNAQKSGYGTKIILAVGGWGGCYWFSQACSSSANRTKFANALVNAVNTLNLDGIDLDWEYPNSPGAGNPYSPKDAENLLSLIQLLRIALGPCKTLSAAVPHLPWLGANGQPLTDVSRYAAFLDYINIMNYDVWGSSANPGPNAPIGNLCGTSKQPRASAQGALDAWQAAKMPPSKLVLGLPLYGYVSKSSKKVLTGSSLPSEKMLLLENEELPSKAPKKEPQGKGVGKGDVDGGSEADLEDGPMFLNGAHSNDMEAQAIASAAYTGNEIRAHAPANLSPYWGRQIAFKDIVRFGALVKKADGNYGQAGDFTMAWDNCSNTPFLYNQATTTVVSYDDTWSLSDKAKFARTNGMAGCFTWSLDQDDGITLTNAIRKGLGK